MSGSVLILGGRSDIGLAVAHRFAAEGAAVHLVARDIGTLEPARADVALRHDVEAKLSELDLLDTEAVLAFVEGLDPLPEVAICVVGLLGDQEESERDPAAAARVMRSNYEAPVLVMNALAHRFEARASGTLVGISSVAGDRGRASNYVYGSAKAGFTAALSGLRNRLAKSGVHVLTVKPGFVATQMTAGMDLPPALTARPEAVAKAIHRAVERRRNLVYVKPVWWPLMTVIRAIPEPIFKKLSL